MNTSREGLIAEEAAKHEAVRILDIAYAHGPNVLLATLNAEIIGIDPLNRAAPFKEMHAVDVNTHPLPFGDAHFDMVTMGCVLSHLSRPLKLLSEINRVLKPDGTFILSSPNPH
ncbi:class I SAM-dependent methyltransferase, partial [bacterium]